jgi:hypothetical protein
MVCRELLRRHFACSTGARVQLQNPSCAQGGNRYRHRAIRDSGSTEIPYQPARVHVVCSRGWRPTNTRSEPVRLAEQSVSQHCLASPKRPSNSPSIGERICHAISGLCSVYYQPLSRSLWPHSKLSVISCCPAWPTRLGECDSFTRHQPGCIRR